MSKQVKAANSDFLYQILSTGQSLSVGATGTPALTTTQPYSNKMLNSGNTALIPLIEPSTNTAGETISSSMANSLSAAAGNDFQTVVTNHGVGAQAYASLKKGTVPYANGMAQLNAVFSLATGLGKTHKVIGVTTIHGESDEMNLWMYFSGLGLPVLRNMYRDFLVEWQHDYETDVKAVTGQLGTVPLYTDQMSSHTGAAHYVPISAIGQLSAAEENPGKIILVAPKYFLTYTDVYHLNNYSYRLLGEYYGKVVNQVFNEGKTWMPLYPISIIRTGNIVDAKFHVPEPATQIVFDTTAVDAMPNMGFEYSDSSGTTSISNVAISGTDTVRITLSGTPPGGSNQTLAYAYAGMINAIPGPHVAGSAKGNLRDNDPTISAYDSNTHLYNWATHFLKTITVASTVPPSAPTGLGVL